MDVESLIERALRFGKWVLGGVVGCVVLWTVLMVAVIAWKIGNRPTTSTGELVGQGDLFVGAVTYPLTLVLAIATAWYTWTTTHILRETRRTNDLHEADRASEDDRQRMEEIRRHAADLLAATAMLVRHSTDYWHLHGWRARWSVSRVQDRWFAASAGMNDALGDAHVAGARARMLGDPALAAAADSHLRSLESLHQTALRSGDLDAAAGDVGSTQQALELLATKTRRRAG